MFKKNILSLALALLLIVPSLTALTFGEDNSKKTILGIHNPLKRIPKKSSKECIQPYTKQAISDLYNYRVRLSKTLSQNWLISEENQAFRPILRAIILPDGSLKEILIVRTSGNDSVDQEALISVKKVFPFETFPKSVTKKELDWLISYDWMNFILAHPSEEEVTKALMASYPWHAEWNRKINNLVFAKTDFKPKDANQKHEYVQLLALVDSKTGIILYKGLVGTSCNAQLETAALEALDQISPVELPDNSFPLETLPVSVGLKLDIKWPPW